MPSSSVRDADDFHQFWAGSGVHHALSAESTDLSLSDLQWRVELCSYDENSSPLWDNDQDLTQI